MNIINQLVIGAKEAAVEAITKLVGSNITNAILRTADGSDHKSVDDFTLFDIIQVAIDGADRPLTNDVMEQLLKVINHTFDFARKSASTWSSCNQMQHEWPLMASPLAYRSSCSRF